MDTLGDLDHIFGGLGQPQACREEISRRTCPGCHRGLTWGFPEDSPRVSGRTHPGSPWGLSRHPLLSSVLPSLFTDCPAAPMVLSRSMARTSHSCPHSDSGKHPQLTTLWLPLAPLRSPLPTGVTPCPWAATALLWGGFCMHSSEQEGPSFLLYSQLMVFLHSSILLY